MDHSEVPTLDDQRAAGGGEGQLLHRGYVVVQDLGEGQRGGPARHWGFSFCSNASESSVKEQTSKARF